ncbi:MAG: hypothetical protein ACQEQV_10385, partial [Fibrobacterota bacterium]
HAVSYVGNMGGCSLEHPYGGCGIDDTGRPQRDRSYGTTGHVCLIDITVSPAGWSGYRVREVEGAKQCPSGYRPKGRPEHTRPRRRRPDSSGRCRRGHARRENAF